MLEEMDGVHLSRWMAFKRLEAEAEKEASTRAELRAKADAGVKQPRRGGKKRGVR
jgi:hypothetical protein